MSSAFHRRVAQCALLLLGVSCADGVAGPTPSRLPRYIPPLVPPFGPSGSASLTGPMRAFDFKSDLAYPVSTWTRSSRFLLYDNGAFAFQLTGTGKEYRGRWIDVNGTILLDWDGFAAASASATLVGNLLTVRYTPIMQLTDFEDAVYGWTGFSTGTVPQ